MILLAVIATFVSLAAAAFCAGAETAFLSVSRERILHLAREGGRKAKLVQRALADMSRTTTTTLIGNNLASVTYSTATAALIAEASPDSLTTSLLNLLAAFTVLYVSEFLPKLLCAARPLRRSLALAPTYSVMSALLKPLVEISMSITNLFLRGRKEQRYRVTSADIVRILQDRKDGVCLSDLESAIISKIIVLKIKNRPVTAEAILSVLKTDID